MIPEKQIDFCILIPCYNNFTGLIASLNSVHYPIDRYLVLVMDDGSKEAIAIEDIDRETDSKWPVVVLRNEQNQGITRSLNRGLAWIMENTRASYIARLDCGDTCDDRRFFLQVAYLEAHPEVGLLGSWCRFEEKGTGKGYSYTTPTNYKDILRAMYFKNVFIHPTVMFRADLLAASGFYPGGFEYAEDYAFFWKLIRVREAVVLDQFLVICELNTQGLSYQNKGKQLIARGKVVKAFGTLKVLKILGFLRLGLLFILPKRLTLLLKQLKAQ